MTVVRVGKESGIIRPTQRTEDISTFLNEIRGIETLSPEEEIELFGVIKNNDSERYASEKSEILNKNIEIERQIAELQRTKAENLGKIDELNKKIAKNDSRVESARKKIVECNQKFVFSIAKKMGSQANVLDLVDEGNIGLIEAIDKFDPTKGTRFLTFAVWYIRRNMGFYITNHSKMVKTANKQKLITMLPKAKAKFIQENGREPYNDELVEMVEKMFGFKVKNTSDVSDLNFSSINEMMSGDDNQPTPAQLEFDATTASYNDYEEEVEREAMAERLETLLSVCTERDRTILKMLYGIGYDAPVPVEEIGEMFNLGPMRVKQVEKNALAKIKKYATVAR